MKKSRKSKIVLFSVLGLATISLATVGFASWVINEVTPSEIQNIEVAAGTVTDNSLRAIVTATDLKVRFDNNNVEGGFGNANAETEKEDLNFSFSTKIEGTGTFTGLEYKFTMIPGMSSLISEGYITSFANANTFTFSTGSVISGAALQNSSAISYNSESKTFTSTFNFDWGTKFNSKNPSTAYAEGDSSTKATIVTNLKAFGEAVKKITTTPWLSVVVTPVVA